MSKRGGNRCPGRRRGVYEDLNYLQTLSLKTQSLYVEELSDVNTMCLCRIGINDFTSWTGIPAKRYQIPPSEILLSSSQCYVQWRKHVISLYRSQGVDGINKTFQKALNFFRGHSFGPVIMKVIRLTVLLANS